MSYLDDEIVKTLTGAQLVHEYRETIIKIEENDGRLTSGSSAELDLLLENRTVLERELSERLGESEL